jgi:hypothetical protein
MRHVMLRTVGLAHPYIPGRSTRGLHTTRFRVNRCASAPTPPDHTTTGQCPSLEVPGSVDAKARLRDCQPASKSGSTFSNTGRDES